MNKLTTLTLIATSALALTAGAAAAQPGAWAPDHAREARFEAERYGDRGRDDSRGDWVSINRRQAQLDRRIEIGFRNGRLTAAEAGRLRAEFNHLARLEHRYRMNGLSGRERADLDRRFDRLAAQIRWEARDGEQRYGYGYGYSPRY